MGNMEEAIFSLDTKCSRCGGENVSSVTLDQEPRAGQIYTGKCGHCGHDHQEINNVEAEA